MEKKERVILIQGDDSKWYEQAIFIVNQNIKEIPADFVAEAEKIIQNYISKNDNHKVDIPSANIGIAYASMPTYATKSSKIIKHTKFFKNKLIDYILNTVMAIGCILIAAVLMWGLFG